MTTFTLRGSRLVTRELERYTDFEAIHSAAMERLRAAAPNVSWDGEAFVIDEDIRFESDIAARGRELEGLISEKPYLVDGKWVFLPYALRPTATQCLAWNGSVESSKLFQSNIDLYLGEDAYLDWVSPTLYFQVLTKDSDVAVYLGGLPFEGRKRVDGPELVTILRRSDPTEPNRTIVLPRQQDIVGFTDHLLLAPRLAGHEPWTRDALEMAALCRNPYSLMLIDRAVTERRKGLPECPAGLRRTVGYIDDVIAIAAEGTEDDLVVFGDQLREHFASPTVRIVDAVAKPTEMPAELIERVRGALRNLPP